MRLAPDALRLCLVTDRVLAGRRDMRDIVGEALAGGVTMVQVRDKTGSTRAMIDTVLALLPLTRAAGAPLLVNDRVDVAMAAGADGVHLGQDDMPVAMARRLLGPDVIIGLSITGADDLARPDAAEADYLGIGPVFAQATKPDATPPLGLAGLAGLCARTSVPTIAIGGLDQAIAAAVIAAGADGLAVVSAIMAAADPRDAARRLRTATEEAFRLRHG